MKILICKKCGADIQMTEIVKNEIEIDKNGKAIQSFNLESLKTYYECSDCGIKSKILNNINDDEFLKEIAELKEVTE